MKGSYGKWRPWEAGPPAPSFRPASILVWVMVGIAFWHFAVLVPDKFVGGIIGAFLVAVVGAFATGFALPAPGIPTENPPGIDEGLYAIPGAVLALAGSCWWGARQQGRTGELE
jgi:uncharacterized membrane protein YeaQ/YmgE (transglycosylase-associated protein family)